MASHRFVSHLLISLCGMSLATGGAAAQVAASLTATSDVRNRGLSLNGGGVALSASVAYDDDSGVYAGGAATGGTTRRYGVRFLGHSEYIGYAARLRHGLSWEAGLSNTQVESNVLRRFSGRYSEIYAGLSSERLSARVYFSPRYIVSGLSTVYLDVNGALRPSRRTRVFGHAGMLIQAGGGASAVLPKARYDLRAGVAAEFARGEVQIAYIRSGASRAYLDPRAQSRDALTLGASWFF